MPSRDVRLWRRACAGSEGDPVDRLTPLAASFLEAEDVDAAASLAIGSLAVFEGPAPDFDDVRGLHRGPAAPDPALPPEGTPGRARSRRTGVGRRPRLRHRLARPPDRPPRSGRQAEIERLFSRVMTRRMDRHRPLWEYWFCEGLAGGRWALLSKIHHSMVDGVSGSDLYRLVLDPTPAALGRARRLAAGAPASGCRSRPRRCWSPRPHRHTHSAAPRRPCPHRAGWPARLPPAGWECGTRIRAPAGSPHVPDRIPGREPAVCLDRRLPGRPPLRPRRVRRDVNDVALAAIAGGFRRLLESRGESPIRTRSGRWCRSRRGSRVRSPSRTTASP